MEDQSKDSDWEMQVGLMLLTLLGYMGSFEKLARVWREEMTPERKARIPSALFLRVGDALSFDDFDCSKLGGFWGYWLTHSRDVAKWITEETHSLTGVPSQTELVAFTDWVETCFLAGLFSPQYLAWLAASLHPIDALNDPSVQGNPTTVALLEKALNESQMAAYNLSEDGLFWHIKQEAAQSAISAHAARNASRRTLEAREWARKEWANRTNIAMTKTQFGKDYALLVQHKFPEMELIKPSTITRDWLKGL